MNAAEALQLAGVDAGEVALALPHTDPADVPVRVGPRWYRRCWADRIDAVTLPWGGISLTPEVWTRLVTPAEAPRCGALLVHELAHIEQCRRDGPVRHSARYAVAYLAGRLRGLGHWDAYRAIPAEVEARAVAQEVTS